MKIFVLFQQWYTNYYRKFNYELYNTYMVKNLKGEYEYEYKYIYYY